MKCYRCNNELKDNEEFCPECGSKEKKKKNKRIIRKMDVKDEFYSFALSCLITKFLSVFLIFFSLLNLVFPWLLLSFIFALVGLLKYKDKRNVKILIIDGILMLIEIILILVFFKKIISLF